MVNDIKTPHFIFNFFFSFQTVLRDLSVHYGSVCVLSMYSIVYRTAMQ